VIARIEEDLSSLVGMIAVRSDRLKYMKQDQLTKLLRGFYGDNCFSLFIYSLHVSFFYFLNCRLEIYYHWLIRSFSC
jgi:hypothetical protein